jgi:hypothetical protein
MDTIKSVLVLKQQVNRLGCLPLPNNATRPFLLSLFSPLCLSGCSPATKRMRARWSANRIPTVDAEHAPAPADTSLAVIGLGRNQRKRQDFDPYDRQLSSCNRCQHLMSARDSYVRQMLWRFRRWCVTRTFARPTSHLRRSGSHTAKQWTRTVPVDCEYGS